MDKIAGYLEVGTNDAGEIIVNHPKPMDLDAEGRGHFVFSANQARHLAELLLRKAAEVEIEMRRKQEQAAYEAAAKVPVDRSARMLADGSPETPDHREIDPASGQQKGYIVLSPAERAKGFVRPVRRSYRHLKCGTVTTMGQSIAETYARDPGFYSGTFCCECRTHLPLDEFVWEGTNEKVGS